MPRIILCGSRNFNNYKLFKNVADHVVGRWQWNGFFLDAREVELLNCGGKGADALSEKWGKSYGFMVKSFIPQWDNLEDGFVSIKVNSLGKEYNVLARSNSNQELLDHALDGDAPENIRILAFYQGKSTGSKDMIRIAKKAGMQHWIWDNEKRKLRK